MSLGSADRESVPRFGRQSALPFWDRPFTLILPCSCLTPSNLLYEPEWQLNLSLKLRFTQSDPLAPWLMPISLRTPRRLGLFRRKGINR